MGFVNWLVIHVKAYRSTERWCAHSLMDAYRSVSNIWRGLNLDGYGNRNSIEENEVIIHFPADKIGSIASTFHRCHASYWFVARLVLTCDCPSHVRCIFGFQKRTVGRQSTVRWLFLRCSCPQHWQQVQQTQTDILLQTSPSLNLIPRHTCPGTAATFLKTTQTVTLSQTRSW